MGQSIPKAQMMEYPYYWRVKTRLPERKGQPCQVLIRARMNSCLVEFEDGYRVVTSRNYIRKRKVAAIADTQDEPKMSAGVDGEPVV